MAMMLRAHVRQLAEAHGVRVIESDQLRLHEAFAYRKRRCAFVSPISDRIAYATALHELGHLAVPRENTLIREEGKAWAWARQNAVFWTPDMETHATESLATYQPEETFSDQRERLGWILALPDDGDYWPRTGDADDATPSGIADEM